MPSDERGRLTGVALREALDARGSRRPVRGGGERGVDERRGRGRPRRRGRGLPGARAVAARRRRLRRRRAARAVGPSALRRDRARGLVHRRSAQVAVRAVRRLRAPVPRPGDGAHRARPGGLLPRLAERDRRVERERLRVPPHAACARAPAVVLARDLRDRRVPRCGRDRPRRDPAGRRRDPPAPRPRAAARARALGRALPPDRLGPRRLRDLVATAARRPDRVRPAHLVARREGRAPVLRQPEDHAGPRPRRSSGR